MRNSIKTLLVVLLTIMSFSAVQTVWAGRPEPADLLTASGPIVEIDPESSTITVDDGEKEIVIKGFPFGYLEREMAVEFAVGDCVTVEYAIVVCRCSEGSKNIAVALDCYYEVTIEGVCVDNMDYCYTDRIELRDEDFYPVDKSRDGDDSDHHHHQRLKGDGG